MLRENLIMLRNMRGYSQEAIAEAVGVSRQAYAKWESGKSVPDIEKCTVPAAKYGITLDDLVKTERLEGFGMIPPPPRAKASGARCCRGNAAGL